MMRSLKWGLGLFALAAMLLAVACSPSRVAESLSVLRDIQAVEGESGLKRSAPPPRREPVAYRVEGQVYVGDLYDPGGGEQPKAAVVLVPGVVPQGKDDLRIVAFGNTLARARFRVLVPDLANLRGLRVSSADAVHLAHAIEHLHRMGVEEPASVGAIAISYAAGPAVLAAMRSDTRDAVRFIHAIGPYYDLEAVIAYFTTGHFRLHEDDPWQSHEPDPYAKWVFALSNAARLEDTADRDTLARIARVKLDDAGADISVLAARLGPEGASVYRLLVNTDPARVPALVADLPSQLLTEIRGLDLGNKDFGDLKARLILVHGRNDTIIPYTESMKLAEAATAAGGKVHVHIVDSLEHIDLDLSGLADLYKVWRTSYLLLTERDAMPPPAEAVEPVP